MRHLTSKKYFLVLNPSLGKVVGIKGLAEIPLGSELSMRLKVIDVNLVISDNKACHPSLERRCLALGAHLLLARFECILNLLNDAIYHG